MSLYLNLLLIVGEVLLITFLNYQMAGTHVSLDVFYCLPVIQVARNHALRSGRAFDSNLPMLVAIFTALVWSVAEMFTVYEEFPFVAFLLNTFTRAVAFTLIGRVLSRLWKERDYGYMDYLTNLANRAEFLDKFAYEQQRSARSGRPYSLLYIDIDDFKQLNDNLGHRVGDEALGKVAEILRNSCRKMDIIGRIGGDEFVVLFPETGAQGCEVLANRIQERSDEEFRKCQWGISLSIGCVTQTGTTPGVTEALDAADAAMYAIKKAKCSQA